MVKPYFPSWLQFPCVLWGSFPRVEPRWESCQKQICSGRLSRSLGHRPSPSGPAQPLAPSEPQGLGSHRPSRCVLGWDASQRLETHHSNWYRNQQAGWLSMWDAWSHRIWPEEVVAPPAHKCLTMKINQEHHLFPVIRVCITPNTAWYLLSISGSDCVKKSQGELRSIGKHLGSNPTR